MTPFTRHQHCCSISYCCGDIGFWNSLITMYFRIVISMNFFFRFHLFLFIFPPLFPFVAALHCSKFPFKQTLNINVKGRWSLLQDFGILLEMTFPFSVFRLAHFKCCQPPRTEIPYLAVKRSKCHSKPMNQTFYTTSTLLLYLLPLRR